MSGNPAGRTAPDRAAAAAVLAHHAGLAAGLDERAGSLLTLVEAGHGPEAEQARRALLEYLHRDLLPHARAEERRMYPAAAERPAGALLVEGMLDEHRRIAALVEELDAAGSGVRAAAIARALTALFATHLTKENELIVPLLVDDPEVSLADLLAGMHELLGADGGHDATADLSEPPPVREIGVDRRLDVRGIPHDQRHATVLSALDSVPAGEALLLVAPHAPRPLLAEVEARFGAQFTAQWLQSGPEVWQVRLERAAVRV